MITEKTQSFLEKILKKSKKKSKRFKIYTYCALGCQPPSFLPSPHLNQQTVQAPPFLGNPPL